MSEEIRKSFSGGPIKANAAADIDLINRHAIRTLSPDEVRCFSVVMCDNDIDRETERFTDKTLYVDSNCTSGFQQVSSCL